MEKIVVAAIRDVATGLVFSLPKPKRHHDILHAAAALHRPLKQHEQGFLTSFGRYVDRVEAANLALTAKQVRDHVLISPPHLYSEDLW